MDDMKKKILEWREAAERDSVHRAMLTDAADRLENIYKARIRTLPRISEAGRKKAAERGEKIVVVKKIELKMCFPDDFVPPDNFRGDTSTAENRCSRCPFFQWDDEAGEGACCLNAERGCPIKKFFK